MPGALPPPLPPRSGEGEGRERAALASQSRIGFIKVPRRAPDEPSAIPRLPLPALSFSLRGGEEKIWVALLAALAVVGCSKREEAAATYLGLDCAQPFEAQAAAIVAQPKLDPAPVEPAEPYRFYSSLDGKTSYLITQPSAPAHPAMMMQKAGGGTVVTTGCRYGAQKAYDDLHAYLDSLKNWTRK